MIRPIRKLGDPVLRKRANKIEKITKDTLKLIDDMVETMHDNAGIGLAAPQVGVSQRIAVIELLKTDEHPKAGVLFTLINPEVLKVSTEKVTAQEGCLSIPGWVGEVERPIKLVVKAMDRHGNRVKHEVDGWLARAMLHEIDHLDGVLYIDKLIAPERIWPVEEAKVDEKTI
jgi:peptide deformylase